MERTRKRSLGSRSCYILHGLRSEGARARQAHCWHRPLNQASWPPPGQNQGPSFGGLNRHEKLKYSWAVSLGSFNPGQIIRQ